MDQMLAALQSSRAAGPSATPARPAAPEGVGPGDAMMAKMAECEAKLDQILQLLGAEQKQEAPADPNAKEATPHDDGY